MRGCRFVGGEDESADGCAHAEGDVAGEDVAEVAGGDGDLGGGGAGGLLDAEDGPEVVDDLGEDAAPVDGVDGAEVEVALEGEVVEDLLEDALAVVEGAVDGDAVDVRVGDGGHLAFLERADAAVGEHDEDVDAGLSADAVDGGGAGVSAGGAEDVEPLSGLGEDVFEDVAEELEGDVLEGEGWAMEELGDEEVSDLADGDDLGRVEGGVAGRDETAEVIGGDGVADEERHDLAGEFGIGEGAPALEGGGGELRDGVGQEEPAVVGESHQHG